MNICSSELLEVLKIVSQYERDAEVFTYRGTLYIDGLKTCREATKYEREVIAKCGFIVDASGKNAIYRPKHGSKK